MTIDEVPPPTAPGDAAVPLSGFHVPRTIDGERLVALFASLVEPIARALPTSTEVVLHDLSLVPNSIVAIYGEVTGRKIGDPPTDVLLQQAMQGFNDYNLNYESTLPSGRRMRSSTMIIRDVAGNPAAALCIHTDISAWLSIQNLVAQMVGGSPAASPAPSEQRTEVFVKDVDELAAHLIHQAILAVGVPVDEMKKKHKVSVVIELKDRGFFMLRDAIEMISESLKVTKFTIYNYLNEISLLETGTEPTPSAERL
ncbi:putative transcriptional regulator YheO [Glaciihabitans tibetensis]|uniref:Putative transcriptional regulator YheO n=1 Tax=Glaciihabitans tibetensis TaxID=1266600 RepID=A0A2T0V6Q7_9MICO|nr:helix-turn-helix transcriptional regulator [Glaciihabitans tibetensis]PRY65872.1 putative transcriptional regulator YheO [Glaciihabitans tibetensis]